MPQRRSGLIWLFIIAALTAYTLPWVHNLGAILQSNAYDLAEWTSLHPAVQNGTPAFLETLLLRSQLLIIACVVAFHTTTRQHPATCTVGRLVIILIAITLLPPLEYFTAERSNPNYGQQFALAILVAFTSLIGFSNHSVQHYRIVVTLLILAGIITSIISTSLALPLMRTYLPDVQPGIGSLLLPTIYIALLVFHLFETKQH